MGEAIVFTSGKGGVGKTTTIANIGAGLSRLDKKVVMLDTDMGLRNLDVVMGMEDQVQYNLIALLENQCRLKQALIKDKRYPNLYMIPAALRCKKIRDYESKLYTLISHLKQEFDYCLIDCPAGIDDGFHFAVSAADRALVVTTPHISAVRDAGRVLYLLESQRLSQVDLLINSYNSRMVRKHDMLSQKDIEEILGMKSNYQPEQGCSRFIFAFKICKSIYECSTIVGQSADYSGRLKCGRSVHQARYTASFFRKGMWK